MCLSMLRWISQSGMVRRAHNNNTFRSILGSTAITPDLAHLHIQPPTLLSFRHRHPSGKDLLKNHFSTCMRWIIQKTVTPSKTPTISLSDRAFHDTSIRNALKGSKSKDFKPSFKKKRKNNTSAASTAVDSSKPPQQSHSSSPPISYAAPALRDQDNQMSKYIRWMCVASILMYGATRLPRVYEEQTPATVRLLTVGHKHRNTLRTGLDRISWIRGYSVEENHDRTRNKIHKLIDAGLVEALLAIVLEKDVRSQATSKLMGNPTANSVDESRGEITATFDGNGMDGFGFDLRRDALELLAVIMKDEHIRRHVIQRETFVQCCRNSYDVGDTRLNEMLKNIQSVAIMATRTDKELGEN